MAKPASLTIPTEPIGSIPRPLDLIERVAKRGDSEDPDLAPFYEEAIRDTIERSSMRTSHQLERINVDIRLGQSCWCASLRMRLAPSGR
jgi:hypothetical protein